MGFSGSNDTDSISVMGFSLGVVSGRPPGIITSPSGQVAFDGMLYRNFTFSIGNGMGNVSIFDDQNNLLITQDLIGFLRIISETCTGPALTQDCNGSFSVDSVNMPEPGALLLTLAGLGLVGATTLVRKTLRFRKS